MQVWLLMAHGYEHSGVHNVYATREMARTALFGIPHLQLVPSEITPGRWDITNWREIYEEGLIDPGPWSLAQWATIVPCEVQSLSFQGVAMRWHDAKTLRLAIDEFLGMKFPENPRGTITELFSDAVRIELAEWIVASQAQVREIKGKTYQEPT